MKLRNSNHISELLKIQLESRSRNVHTLGTRSGFISTHAVTTQKSIRGSHTVKPRICIRRQLVESNHSSIIVLGSSSIYSLHINHSGQDSLSKIFISSSNIWVQTWGSLEKIHQYQSGQCKMQTADCRPGTKCRLRTGYKMHTEISYCFFRLIRDNMPAYNLPSVTQSLFHDHLSRLFALLCNIPCPFLDHSRS